MNFLVVEDDVVSRHMLTAILKQFGDTEEAVNGVEAVKAYKASKKNKKPYTAIFMDIMMPEQDGNSAAMQIRDIEKVYSVPSSEEAKIIMLSSLSDPKHVMESYYKSGATSYIVKPITADKIKTEFNKLGIK